MLSDISSDSASFGTPPWTQQVSTCNSVVAPVVNSTVCVLSWFKFVEANSVLDLTRLGLKARRMKYIFIHHRIAVHIV